MAGTVPFLVAFIVKDCLEFLRFLLNIRGLGEELVDCWSAAAGTFWRSGGLIGDRLVARIVDFTLAVDAVGRELVEMVTVAADKPQYCSRPTSQQHVAG